MGRFINADGTTIFETDGGNQLNYNLYAYGLNNPINMIDEDDDIAWIAVGFALWAVYDIYVAVKEPTKENIFYAAIGVVPFGKISKSFKISKKFTTSIKAGKKYKLVKKNFVKSKKGKTTRRVLKKSKQIKKISNSYFVKRGINVHALKYEYLGRRVNISHYDLYNKDGYIWIFEKNGKGTGIKTHLRFR